ncbi:pre-mRNA branch site p14-like protein [Striga asiatica]|uniref:Pre-mRNA branch site p14-like protein n=1 Tax=Striga asiatica TaxID=4170 RepID=A0A5A7Q679_STRAF|nr:pre-mRNA branch site p14-like protein [Striga asiatica]
MSNEPSVMYLLATLKPDRWSTAFVAYEDIHDAKNAVDHLSVFNVANRWARSLTRGRRRRRSRGFRRSTRLGIQLPSDLPEFGEEAPSGRSGLLLKTDIQLGFNWN